MRRALLAAAAAASMCGAGWAAHSAAQPHLNLPHLCGCGPAMGPAVPPPMTVVTNS